LVFSAIFASLFIPFFFFHFFGQAALLRRAWKERHDMMNDAAQVLTKVVFAFRTYALKVQNQV
jgi:hypothetical protein